MYSLIEYSDIYLKTSGSLWQYCRDEPFSDNNEIIFDITGTNYNSKLLKYKQKSTSETDANSKHKNYDKKKKTIPSLFLMYSVQVSIIKISHLRCKILSVLHNFYIRLV